MVNPNDPGMNEIPASSGLPMPDVRGLLREVCGDDAAGDEGVDLIESGHKYDEIFAVGPVGMQRAICNATRPYGIKTTVSMAPLMIDSMIISIGTYFVINKLVPVAYNEIFALRDDIKRTKNEQIRKTKSMCSHPCRCACQVLFRSRRL